MYEGRRQQVSYTTYFPLQSRHISCSWFLILDDDRVIRSSVYALHRRGIAFFFQIHVFHYAYGTYYYIRYVRATCIMLTFSSASGFIFTIIATSHGIPTNRYYLNQCGICWVRSVVVDTESQIIIITARPNHADSCSGPGPIKVDTRA